MAHEEGFRGAEARLADDVEERLQQLLQKLAAGSDLASAAGLRDPTPLPEQQQQQQQQQGGGEAAGAATAVKAEGEGGSEAQAAAAAPGQQPADAMQVDGQQAQQPSPTPEAEGDGERDPHGLRDAARPFNALRGCRTCWRDGDNARLLLCDGCEEEYHCYCVTPALLEVPEGDWYCHLCRLSGSSGQPGNGSGASCSSAVAPSSSWDMAAAAQLPETCTAAITNRSSSMQYIRQLVGAAQRLTAANYGSWPAEARLQLALLLCELLAGSSAGRRFMEERLEAKREAKKKVGRWVCACLLCCTTRVL
jgi:hypothetical protein